MTTQYPGVDAFPVDFTLSDDSVPVTAAIFNVGLKALADRTIALKNHSPRLETFVYIVTGPLVVPERVTAILALTWGGGGGGGGAGPGSGGAGAFSCPGGGGAGAIAVWQVIPVNPLETLQIVIGAGGAGGIGGTPVAPATTDGADGSPTQILRGTTVIAQALGGRGGTAGKFDVASGLEHFMIAPGGAGPAVLGAGNNPIPPAFVIAAATAAFTGLLLPSDEGAGGAGISASSALFTPTSRAGIPSRRGYAGGVQGVSRPMVAGFCGGGGGGGGGAGPNGPGANGGDGGVASTTIGSDPTGQVGVDAAANSGAGGGGGGSGGCQPSPHSPGPGAQGGVGGSGAAILILAREFP